VTSNSNLFIDCPHRRGCGYSRTHRWSAADTNLVPADPEAAAAILAVLNKILGLSVDVKKLMEKGEEIRITARDLMKRTHESMSEMQKSQEHEAPMMYR